MILKYLAVKRRKNLFSLCAVLCAAALLLSCAGSPRYETIDTAVASDQFQKAASQLEAQKGAYGRSNIILYDLDAGMLNHYAENYRQSIALLQNGERGIADAYTKSITQAAASFLANDNSKSYEGEDYEDIYISAFNALNYYHEGNIEDAAVEIRRMNEKLAYLSTKYAKMEAKLQAEADKEASKQKKSSPAVNESPQEPVLLSSKFANSALGRYLGMLFYRGIGEDDNARIDRDWLKAAYANAPEIYDFPLPSSIDDELEVPQGKARLNVIGFGGLSPIKQETVSRIPIGLGFGDYIKIALPEMQYRPSQISRIEVVFDDGAVFNLEKIENIEAVARETFNNKIGLIKFKTILRATIKGVGASTFSAIGDGMMSESDDAGTSLVGAVFSLIGIIGKVSNEISEQADIRSSRYFPGSAYVGGINVDPGAYSFRINYYSAGGSLLASAYQENVPLRAGRLNLVETYCLK